jgi:uncharacterized protein
MRLAPMFWQKVIDLSVLKIVGLFHYPIKSLPGISLEHVNVDRLGLKGDRRWMIVDETGSFQTFRENPWMAHIAVSESNAGLVLKHHRLGSVEVRFPPAGSLRMAVKVWNDTVSAACADKTTQDFISSIFEKRVCLVYLVDPKARGVDPNFGQLGDFTSFTDGFPILLTSTASLEALNLVLGKPVEMRRFRPNIVVSGDLPWAEDTWRLLSINGARFRVAKSCTRCVMTTRDPDTGVQADPFEPLQSLSKIHRSPKGKISFGQNLIPDQPTELRLGDGVEIIESGISNLI